jgi:hypothetical protein
LQKNKSLFKEYSNDSEVGRWLKYFFVLPYLDPNDISDAFTEIISIAPYNISMDFPDYILKNYIGIDFDFEPELVNLMNQTIAQEQRMELKTFICTSIVNFIPPILIFTKSFKYL